MYNTARLYPKNDLSMNIKRYSILVCCLFLSSVQIWSWQRDSWINWNVVREEWKEACWPLLWERLTAKHWNQVKDWNEGVAGGPVWMRTTQDRATCKKFMEAFAPEGGWTGYWRVRERTLHINEQTHWHVELLTT